MESAVQHSAAAFVAGVHGHRRRRQSCPSKRGMEIWKTLRVSHISTPPAATADKLQTRRYTNNLLGTKSRSAQVLGDRMYATRKSDLKSFTPNSKSVCGINDGSTNAYLKEDRAIEEFLKTIEPKYNEALAKLIGDKIDEQCIYTIGGVVAHVVSCSPAGMRI